MNLSESALIVAKGMEELGRLVDIDVPALAYAFKRRGAEDWSSPHSHTRGQLLAFTKGLLIIEAGTARWMFPSPRCVWIPPDFEHCARSVGGAAGSMVYLSPVVCRGLAKRPCMFGPSQLLFAIIHQMLEWNPWEPPNAGQKRLIAVLRDELRQPDQQPLHLPIPNEERLARVTGALLQDVADDRTFEEWARSAGMARRTFMRAFSDHLGMTVGRWRQQARLFAALEMLAEGKSVTEAAIAVGYDSVSAFVDMFRTMMGTTPRRYFRSSETTTRASKR